MARPRSTTRDELLTAIVQHVATNGFGDLSLRPLAEAVGTSHRMLLFHFGSKEQLMVEVVRVVEAEQRAAVEQMVTTGEAGAPLHDQMRKHWHQLLDPSLRNNIRLFFEVYADALRGAGHASTFLDEVMGAWLPPVIAGLERAGVASTDAAVDARLMLAMTRGLLLDLVTTGDTAAVDAAMQRFAAMYAASTIPG